MPDSRWIWSGFAGFIAGVLAMAILVDLRPEVVAPLLTSAASTEPQGRPLGGDARVAPAPRLSACPPGDTANPPHIPPTPSAAVADLRTRPLALPLDNASRQDLRSSFDEQRGAQRSHEAIDILAPRHTPVRAVEDGCVVRLFVSKDGGNTIYQFDPSARYAYYYAHLEGYAEDLHDGTLVSRGQVIGYVGTSGNAPRDVPHLHFAIFVLTPERHWWQGTAIDPYEVWGP
jgi:murein DD-endopeptidase MepM/ murein hydrolase activator NlpD